MYKITFVSLYVIVFSFKNCFAQNLPQKKDLLAKMLIANNYLQNKNKIAPKNDFSSAVYFDGLLAFQKISKSAKQLDFINKWAKKIKYNLPEGISDANAEDIAIGSLFLELYKTDTLAKEKLMPIKLKIDSLVDSYRLDNWADLKSLYAIMPILAKIAVITKEEKYHDKLFQVFIYMKNIEGLYSEQELLWFSDKNFKAPCKTPNGQNCFWSSANGFLGAGLTKVLTVLPKDAPHYGEYMDSYLEMMIATMNLQREDGFWNVSLTDPKYFEGKELIGTALITYCMAWGLANNIIDKTTFTPIVTKAINGLLKDSFNKSGFLAWSQGAAKEPKDNQPLTKQKVPNNEYLGLGCFLLAASEVEKLVK